MQFLSIKKTALALALVAGGAVAGGGAAFAYQSHMYNALGDLRAAAGQLSAARADKGGHRSQAMSLINQAIYQTKLGIRYGAM